MLKGQSLFKIELIKSPTGYIIKKSANNEEMAFRLHKQAHKQHLFHNLLINSPLHHIIETPDIIGSDDNYVIMKFCNGKSILDIFEKGDITILDELIEKLFSFIKWEIDQCTVDNVNKILLNKLDKIDNKLVVNCKEYLSKNEIVIPIGLSHGDLTLSNIIFSNKIVLIDFLDSYLESPLQDIAKLLQEINLRWSLLMSNYDGDLTKINISYSYLKDKITTKIEENYKVYLKEIKFIYLITLLRILPYIDNEQIYELVNKEIEKISKELE